MTGHEDAEWGVRVLPGVDLALWMRIIVGILLAAVAVGVLLAVR